MSIITQPKIDCHCHVIDPVRFPYRADTRYRPSGQEVAPLDHFLRIMDLHGVRHALVVSTNSGYAEDLSPVLDALTRGEGRFEGIAVVANDIAAADLARLKANGMVGVAFNAPFNDTAYYAQTGDLLRKLTDLDMFLQIQVKEDHLLEFLPLIEGSDVRLIMDHCGRPTPERGLDQPGFKALLELGRAGRASVKLSGFSQFSGERYPYSDARPYIDALLEAFTSDGCMWGSDWPFLRAAERIDYGPLLLLAETILPDETNRSKVLWDTPRRLFGFGA
jgi:predicted TIM-barrel fold metal-dependent hydrolase